MNVPRLREIGLPKVEYAALVLSTLAFILTSAKWLIPGMAWLAPGLLIFFFRRMGLGKAILLCFAARLAANLIGGYEVVPFPTPVFVITMSIAALVGIIPYLFDRWVNSRIPGFISTLAFPALAVSIEYLDSLGPGGTWGSIAHTQYQFQSLIQIASMVGIWGISFLIYWVASVFNWAYENRESKSSLRFGSTVIGGVFLLVLLFGQFRLSPLNANESSTVRVAGITASIFQLMETIYQDYSGERLKINPKISQSSPELQEINKAMVPFIKDPNEPKFKNSRLEMARIHDELFTLSQEEADAGAKIILWSEGNAFAFKEDEEALVARGREFAQKNNLYLLLATVVITPGEIIPGEKFQENKTLLIDPKGIVLDTYYKNVPVPVVEPSVVGDGTIPVFDTPYGRLAPVICYDADHQTLIRQAGVAGADILLVPSGDWWHISPYHTYMAVMRGIENGFSVVRQVSGGLSIATDPRGNILASMDFYKNEDKVNIAYVPTKGIKTIYSVIGDAFAWLCCVATFALFFLAIRTQIPKSGLKLKKPKFQPEGILEEMVA